jgi:transcriptional regulator of met regulon
MEKTNNQVENLEWATTSENKIHAYAHELMTRKGDEHRRDFLVM